MTAKHVKPNGNVTHRVPVAELALGDSLSGVLLPFSLTGARPHAPERASAARYTTHNARGNPGPRTRPARPCHRRLAGRNLHSHTLST